MSSTNIGDFIFTDEQRNALKAYSALLQRTQLRQCRYSLRQDYPYFTHYSSFTYEDTTVPQYEYCALGVLLNNLDCTAWQYRTTRYTAGHYWRSSAFTASLPHAIAEQYGLTALYIPPSGAVLTLEQIVSKLNDGAPHVAAPLPFTEIGAILRHVAMHSRLPLSSMRYILGVKV